MLPDRIAALDAGLFEHVGTQTTLEDRLSLLAIHDAVAHMHERFSLLEIGSFRGGTLQVAVADDRCIHIVSIDPRPPEGTPDDRPAGEYHYPGNTTEAMLERLSRYLERTPRSSSRSKPGPTP